MELNGTLNDTFNYYCEYNPEDPSCWLDAVPPPFKLTPGKIVSAIAIAALIVVALGGNILVCTAFFVFRRLRKTTNFFILSLALSDILVATVAMPMWLSYEVTAWHTLPAWIDFTMLLRFWNWFDILAGVSSITNLTAISIDRCLSIMTPLLHRTRMTNTIAIIMVLIAWVYSIMLASLSLAQVPQFTAIVASLGFFFPLLIIVISYVTIYLKVKLGGYGAGSDKDWNLERTLLIVISVFVICWLPFFILAILYHYCFSCEFQGEYLPYIISFTKWMHYLNSCCNPFIYGLFNLNFKNAFRALLKHCFVTTRQHEHDGTTLATDGQKTSLKCHIIGLKRKLKLKRNVRGGSFLLSDADTGSVCVTVIPSHAATRNTLLHNEPTDAWNGTEVNSNIPPKDGATRKKLSDSSDGTFRQSSNSDVADDDVTLISGSYGSQAETEREYFLRSQDSQESCV